jgi:hypothetical protein
MRTFILTISAFLCAVCDSPAAVNAAKKRKQKQEK